MTVPQYCGFTVFIIALFTSGCTPYFSSNSCANHNWYAQGFKDGRYGKPLSPLSQETQGCATQSLSAHADEYQQGWNKGIQAFCTEENAHQRGLAGQELIDYCPQTLKQPYVQAWHQGLEQYCSIENGFNQGRATSAYPTICSEYHMTDFTLAYRSGLATHQEMKQIKQQIRKIRRNNKAMHLTSAANLTPTEQAEMTQLSQQLEALEQQYNQLRDEAYQKM
jgi:hypothetical protein